MDPLSSPVVEALKLRPVQSVNTNLSVLLRDGLVVAGEILDVNGSTAFLSLGGQRVAAETDVELQPGQRFLARVEREGDAIVLRLVTGAPDEELPLVTALRTALADHAPAGTLLSQLTTDLRAALVQRETAAAGNAHAGASAREPGGDEANARAITSIQKLLSMIGAQVGAPAADGRALVATLARSGLFHEALLLRGESGSRAASDDLKTTLLRALEELPGGAERDGVRHALGGIEAEQLLDVARAQSGDARSVTFAVPDGAVFADAHIVVDPERHARDEAPTPRGGSASSVDVCVDFSALGPVKAELRMEGGSLRVRFLVASRDVAERLALDQEQLCADLGRDVGASNGHSTQLTIALVEMRSIARTAVPSDVRFLGEHVLLDRTA